MNIALVFILTLSSLLAAGLLYSVALYQDQRDAHTSYQTFRRAARAYLVDHCGNFPVNVTQDTLIAGDYLAENFNPLGLTWSLTAANYAQLRATISGPAGTYKRYLWATADAVRQANSSLTFMIPVGNVNGLHPDQRQLIEYHQVNSPCVL